MIVKRKEPDVIRISPDGSLTIPEALMVELCKRMNHGDEAGLRQDLEDFGPGRLVVLSYAGSESGTEITIQRDRRQEAKR